MQRAKTTNGNPEPYEFANRFTYIKAKKANVTQIVCYEIPFDFMNNKVIFIILAIMLLLGTAVRVYDLTERTMTHSESYVPGIALPVGLSVPAPRFTLKQTLVGLLAYEEPHPPGYYILMLAWTKLLGSDIFVLRLPSVVFALLSILLLYFLAGRDYGKTTGLIAAGMLAFNGYHVFWAQLAKLYSLACLLGIASSLVLISVVSTSTRSKRLFLHFLYMGLTLFGLATTHYFWFLLIPQVFWVLIRARSVAVAPEILRVQLATTVMASPLLSLAIFQSRRPSYLGGNVVEVLGHYFQFGILFEPDWSSPSPGSLQVLGGVILMILGLLVFGMGLRAGETKGYPQDKTIAVDLWSAVALLASPIAFLGILRLASFTRGFDADYSRLVLLSSVLPIALVIGFFTILRKWHYLRQVVTSIVGTLPWRLPTELSPYVVILPVAILTLISPIVNLVALRGLLLFVPSLLIVIARGVVWLANRTRVWVVLAVVLIFVHPLSIHFYKNSFNEHPTDYKALAEQWEPQIEDSDLILVQRHWVTTPIFYYLRSDEHHFVGSDYEEMLRSNPDSRVWVLSFEGLPYPEGLEGALAGYDPVMNLEALRISTSLYSPSKNQS